MINSSKGVCMRKRRLAVFTSLLATLCLAVAGLIVGTQTAYADIPESVDLILFIGQSNMAGRGNAAEATVVPEGHAYEFRAISDPTRLYPLSEPFGVNENNPTSGVNETKKTGSLVSAFCESYFAATGTPVVAVSCAQGGTGINFWDTNRPAYQDACNRLALAKKYLGENVRHTYLVWLQGETDGDNGVTAERYKKTLDEIFAAFRADVGVEQSFVIPIGAFNGASAATKAGYDVIRAAQADYCASSERATLVSTQLVDLSNYGFMTDNFHFSQVGYNIVGADAGKNAAYYAINGVAPVCEPYESQRTPLKTGGAWKEEGGRIVIAAASALENSVYASATSRYVGDVRYYWRRYNGLLDGVEQRPDNGKDWNTGTGFDRAPQLNYTVSVEETGPYYLYFLTSHPDTGGNSMLACLDGNPLLSCALGSYGKGIWQFDPGWKFEIATAGEHTLTVCAREDGIVINQIVLSKRADEAFADNTELVESDRLPIEKKGAFVEVGGKVTIDLVSALENSDAAKHVGGKGQSNGQTLDYTWEHGSNGRGMQIFPKDTMQWKPDSADKPRLSYQVDFTTTGDYYAYLYASFTDASSDSAMLGIDDATPIELARPFSSSGANRWSTETSWKITVPTVGVHTLHIYARESGANMHKLYLSQTPIDSVGANDPDISPRLVEGTPTETGGRLFIKTDDKTVTAAIEKAGEYTLYAAASGDSVSVTVGETERTEQVAANGWTNLGTFTANAGATQFAVEGEVRYLYAEHADNANVEGLETLILGDSYTHKTYWAQFDEQMAEIGAKTIGVSGSEVDNWAGRVSEFNLYAPRNIVIHLGVNDINRGESGQSCGNSIIGFIRAIQTAFPETKIFYVAICDNNSNRGKWSEYAVSNGLVQDFAAREQSVHFIDFNTEMKTHAAEMTNNGFSGDNLHMNAQGYERFSAMIKAAVRAAND